MTEHAGKVAFITGGSSGIGQAVAGVMAAQGASVAVNAPSYHEAQAAVDSINADGGKAMATEADVRDAAAISAAIGETVRTFAGLDVLVTSAGIQRYGTVAETGEKLWDEVFAVNVKGVYLTARAALPHLRRSGAGAIVVVSSVQAHAVQEGVAAYTASKAALNALARSMAIDEACHGIRVNAVCPGSVDTPMLRHSAELFGAGRSSDEVVAEWGTAHPLGRVARPAEVAEAITFLLDDRSSFVTGTELRVDGGLTAKLPVAIPDRQDQSR